MAAVPTYAEARTQLSEARAQYYLAMALEHPIILGFLFGLGAADLYLIATGRRRFKHKWS